MAGTARNSRKRLKKIREATSAGPAHKTGPFKDKPAAPLTRRQGTSAEDMEKVQERLRMERDAGVRRGIDFAQKHSK